MGKIDGKKLVIYMLFAFTDFVFLINSPMHPMRGFNIGTDSAVFQTIAMMMKNGYMPYSDSFDHKGPLIYLINYIGKIFFDNQGVWIIEFISLFVTMVMLYFTARMVNKSDMQCMIAIFTGLSLLVEYFEGGNFTEEYAMPFLAVGLYIFLCYLIKNKVTKLRVCICGVCFGAVCLLRANMIGLWIVFCLFILLQCLYKRQFAELGKFIIWFTVGFSIIVLPMLIWLYRNDALKDFWFDYVEFNLIYSSASGGKATSLSRVKSIYTFCFTVVYSLSLEIIVFCYIKKRTFLYGVYMVYLIIDLLFLAMSGMTYGHYGMLLIPSVVFPIALLLQYINDRFERECMNFVVVFLILNAIAHPCFRTVYSAYSVLRNDTYMSENMNEVVKIIDENTDEDDRISVYGNYNIIYILSERMHATKYSYQFPIGEVYPEIMREFWQDLYNEQPSIIVVQENHYDDDIRLFLDKNNYILLCTKKVEVHNNGTPDLLIFGK